jgi:hypothetical protein
MFEKEKKQYAEDSRAHKKPWELWEWRISGCTTWSPLLGDDHMWLHDRRYRRKPTAFVPEYYSGLNWRDAKHLVGKIIECTNNPDETWKVRKLGNIVPTGKNFYVDCASFFTYIRTCKETFKHPTINIGGVELPKPETVAPALGIKCWLVPACDEFVWDGYNYNTENLQAGRVHLTEDRAQAWADWWKTTVVDKMK